MVLKTLVVLITPMVVLVAVDQELCLLLLAATLELTVFVVAAVVLLTKIHVTIQNPKVVMAAVES